MPKESRRTGRPASNGRVALSRTTLLRDTYRSLLNTGRTYAGFRESDRHLVARLLDRSPIFDPMSGYGGLASFCSELGVESFGIEFNPPQYYWQLLSSPSRAQANLKAIAGLAAQRAKWPRPRQRAVVGDNFFPTETITVLESLLEQILNACSRVAEDGSPMEMAIALLLPFAGRLACTSPGDLSTHTKEGGTCVLLGWQDDFEAYLHALASRLKSIHSESRCARQVVILGDARTSKLGRRRFKSMITSPPYPNHRDFSSILLPENVLLDLLQEKHFLPISTKRSAIIGSNFVRGDEFRAPHSSSASAFLCRLLESRRSQRGKYDDDVYYIPYFKKYFSAIEDAYSNISRYLDSSFEGYIVVVNNTHRGLIVPVAEFIQEVWSRLGFSSSILMSRESFHLGTRNPHARGIRARHTEYVVKVWR